MYTAGKRLTKTDGASKGIYYGQRMYLAVLDFTPQGKEVKNEKRLT